MKDRKKKMHLILITFHLHLKQYRIPINLHQPQNRFPFFIACETLVTISIVCIFLLLYFVLFFFVIFHGLRLLSNIVFIYHEWDETWWNVWREDETNGKLKCGRECDWIGLEVKGQVARNQTTKNNNKSHITKQCGCFPELIYYMFEWMPDV